MKVYPYTLPALAVTWMFLKGTLTIQAFLEGLLFGVAAILVTRAIIRPETSYTFPRLLKKVPPFLAYLGFFISQIIVGNLDVAYRALHPKMPISPGILAINIEGKSELEVAMMANTITLTPGTLTMDVNLRKKVMYVHTISARELEEVRQELKQVEHYVSRVVR